MRKIIPSRPGITFFPSTIKGARKLSGTEFPGMRGQASGPICKTTKSLDKSKALGELDGKSYVQLSKMSIKQLISYINALPYPEHAEPLKVSLNNGGEDVFLRRVVLTPLDVLKPSGIPLKKWLESQPEEERVGYNFYKQHKKLMYDNFPPEEILYATKKEWLEEHLLERLPDGHTLKAAKVEYIVAYDKNNQMIGFISVESTPKGTGLVGYVVTVPKFRRTGLTEHLYRAAYARFRECRVKYVLGEVELYGEKEKKERADLLNKKEANGLSKQEEMQLNTLERLVSRLRSLSTHGRLLVKGFPYFQPAIDSGECLQMNLVITPLEKKTDRISGSKVLGLVKDIHKNPIIYGNDLSAIPKITAELEKLMEQGITSFELAPLWDGKSNREN